MTFSHAVTRTPFLWEGVRSFRVSVAGLAACGRNIGKKLSILPAGLMWSAEACFCPPASWRTQKRQQAAALQGRFRASGIFRDFARKMRTHLDLEKLCERSQVFLALPPPIGGEGALRSGEGGGRGTLVLGKPR